MTTDQAIQELLCADIRPGDNDRKRFDAQSLQNLAQSIKDHGLAQPIIVRPMGGAVPFFEIIAGERRFRAVSQVLGRKSIQAIVRLDLNDEDASAIMLAENVQRDDLNPIEEAQAYQKRIDKFGWSPARVAKQAVVSDTKVRQRLELLKLVPEAQHLIATSQMPIRFGVLMADLDTNRQRIALRWLRDQPALPTSRVFNRLVSELIEQQAQDQMFDMNALIAPSVSQAIQGSENGKLHEILPTLPHLPHLPHSRGSIGKVVDHYIAVLISQGLHSEASVMMDFWVKAMAANYGVVNAFESETLTMLPEYHGPLGAVTVDSRAGALEF